MLSVLRVVAEVVMVLWALIQIVERPGDGAEKKQQVETKFREWVERFGGTWPGWLREFLQTGPFVSFLIDTLVWFANHFGFFRHEAQPAGSQST